MTKSEKMILGAYLKMPSSLLLEHQFELHQDYLCGYVDRFLSGERFNKDFKAFSCDEINIINPLISKNINNDNGKDLLTFFLITKSVCNILNKYKN